MNVGPVDHDREAELAPRSARLAVAADTYGRVEAPA